MSNVLKLKRDPAWFKSLPLIADTMIFLQGDVPDRQVPVPAALLVAISPLVRNILSNGHLPPAFSTPIISIPSVSLDTLESVGEMLVSGMVMVDKSRIWKVRKLFKMMGIVFQTEREEDFENEDAVIDKVKENTKDKQDALENLVNTKSEDCVKEAPIDDENAKLERSSQKDFCCCMSVVIQPASMQLHTISSQLQTVHSTYDMENITITRISRHPF